MKQKLLFFLFFSIGLCNFKAIAQFPPVLDWQQCLGGTGDDKVSKIIRSNDGGYIIAGSTTSTNCNITFNYGVRDFWVVKLASTGAIQWQKTFGGSGSESAASILELDNNDILVAGSTSSTNGNVTFNHGGQDNWLIRLNPSGNIIWQKTFGGSLDDICFSLDLCIDGGFILGGNSSSNNGNVTGNNGNIDCWIVKTDSLGNLQWQQSLGGSGIEGCRMIKATSDGGYLATGYTNSNDGQVSGNHGGYDYWAVKLNSSGSVLWQKCLGGSSNEVSTTAIENTAGVLLIGGYSNSGDGDITDSYGSSDYWLARLDPANGNLLSQRSYGGTNSDIAYDLVATADGGYILAGGSLSSDFDVSSNHGGEDFWLSKTDAAGNIAWARTYGGTGNDRPSSIVQDDDGGFSVTGYTFSNNNDVSGNNGGSDIWFLKLSCLTPVSNFTTAQNIVCVNSLVSFTNASVHSAQYEWQINDVTFSFNTNPDFQFYFTGTYKISLISYTCYETDTMNTWITVVDYPVPSITSGNAYLCEGNSTILSTIPADSYAWNTGETTSSITIQSGGVYSVAVTTNGCSASTSFSINQYSNPVIELGNDLSICSGSSVTLHAQPGYQSYLWQDGSSDSMLTVSAGGFYSVTVSNGFCNSTDAVQVSLISNPVPSITSGSSYVCEGSSVTLSTTPADSYAWNTGESSSSISVYSGGVYSVTVTTDGCSGSTSVTIGQHPTPAIHLGNDTNICSGYSITLYAQQGYQSYLWQDGSSGSNFTANSGGLYYVIVSNGYCSSTDTIAVSLITCAVLTADFSANQTSVCQNTCVNFIDLSQNAISWNWSFPGATITSSNQHNPGNICYNNPGSYPVTLVVHDMNGIADTLVRTAYITVNAIPSVPVITPNGTSLSSTNADYYQWLFNSTAINGATSQTYDALQSGYYSVMITDANGCSAVSDSVYIGITGIEIPMSQNEIIVYPNPAKGIFYLFFVKNNVEKTEVEVTDAAGKTIFYSVIEDVDKLSIETINLEDFSNGVYFLHLKADSRVMNKRLVIQR